MKRTFLLLAGFFFLFGFAFQVSAQQHTVDCWLENLSPYRPQTNFKGIQPSLSDLHSFMQTLALRYTVPVEVIAAVCFQESQVMQYDAPAGAEGFLIHNLNECRNAFHTGEIDSGAHLAPPPGLGLMQLTGATATDPSIPNHDPVKDITDWRYNLEAGVQVLSQKYDIATEQAPGCVASILASKESRKILENWFYAIQFYNGAPTADEYRDTVYGHIKTPEDRIKGLFPPVTITRPEAEIAGFSAGDSFAVNRHGTWMDKNCAIFVKGAASIHISTTFATPYANQFGNISTRMSVGTGENVLIGGFIITGAQSKKVIVRAIGPSVALAGVLADPVLQLHNSTGQTIATNDNWGDATNKQEIVDSTVAPTNARESAILMTLAPGAYTAIVSGKNNTSGIGLVELYDLNTSASAELGNISTRGFVQTGNNVMIGGLIVVGQASQKVIVRAIGPSVPVAGALADPTLELHNSHGDIIASNDNWKDTQQAAIQATGIPPANDAESAIVTTLVPGAYTAIVRGAHGAAGVALVEAYSLN